MANQTNHEPIQFCNYPDCECPFDRDGSDPICIRGLPIACAVENEGSDVEPLAGAA